MLCLPGGLCFAYNCDLYYQTYFPGLDLQWWLFTAMFGMASIGVLVGGAVSDRITAKTGFNSRFIVLALSQVCGHG